MIRRLIPIFVFALVACSGGDDSGPVRVDIVGTTPEVADPLATPPTRTGGLFLNATAQGLVRFDANGEIEPALAKRWIVLDDGLTYIFRLNDVVWADGTALTAGQIARQLRTASGSRSRNRLAPLLADIEGASAVTPQILEINLKWPRSDFLQLLAQADLGLMLDGDGLGPLEIADGYAIGDDAALLAPYHAPIDEEDEDAERPAPTMPEQTVLLNFEDARLAVARFQLELTDVVLGGGWATLPLADAIDPANDQLILDEAEGLFGLAFVEECEFLSDAGNRQILSMTVDRELLADFLDRDEAEARERIIPGTVSDVENPVQISRLDADMAGRRRVAEIAVTRWEAVNGNLDPLRIALPDQPGSRIIFAVLRNSWSAIGIEVERVDFDGDADLRLVDRVAATDHATWYLQFFRCDRGFPCSDDYGDALGQINEAESQRVRAIRIAEAASELEDLAPFIPLTRPIRWSLVSSRITGFTPNRHVSHPLDQLIAPSS